MVGSVFLQGTLRFYQYYLNLRLVDNLKAVSYRGLAFSELG